MNFARISKWFALVLAGTLLSGFVLGAEPRKLGDSTREMLELQERRRQAAAERAKLLREARLAEERRIVQEAKRKEAERERLRAEEAETRRTESTRRKQDLETRAQRITEWLDRHPLPWKSALALLNEYAANASDSDLAYTGQEMHVVGVVSMVDPEAGDEPQLMLNNRVAFRLTTSQGRATLRNYSEGSGVIVRGTCEGKSGDGILIFSDARIVGRL